MNILWIPHSPSQVGVYRRDRYFIDVLKKRHNIHTLTWRTWKDGGQWASLIQGARFYPVEIDGLSGYHVRRIPDLLSKLSGSKHKVPPLNQRLFRRDIRRIVRDNDIDMVVSGPSSYMTGYPPFDLDVPLVFDYLDCGDWQATPHHTEKEYLRHSDAVLCVSHIALERARKFGKPTLYLPNGADVTRLRAASGAEIRRKYDLEDAIVVSLIGLTCSPSLYFIESVLQAKRQLPSLKCLLVGNSPEIKRALEGIPNADDTFVYVGPVPYKDTAFYFAASDIGMYPVDETVYYDAASPIKIFEYAAAGKPVVAPQLTELRHLSLPNVEFASPDVSSFADGIVRAAGISPGPIPQIEDFDWQILSNRLERFIMEILFGDSSAGRREPPTSGTGIEPYQVNPDLSRGGRE